MRKVDRTLALVLILILILIITVLYLTLQLTVKPEDAQSIATPSVPKFSLQIAENPYYVTPITSFDPNTGQNVTIQSGYQCENRTIDVLIENQPFAPYEGPNGHLVFLAYNISVKAHSSDIWSYYPNSDLKLPLIGRSSTTVVIFGYENNARDSYTYPFNITNNDQVDFRVEAEIGYNNATLIPGTGFAGGYSFVGKDSGWSNTQIITIPTS
jgi:hypothetical protein